MGLEGRAEVVAFDKDPVSAPSLERINKVDDWPSSVGFNCRNNLVTKTGFNKWFSLFFLFESRNLKHY